MAGSTQCANCSSLGEIQISVDDCTLNSVVHLEVRSELSTSISPAEVEIREDRIKPFLPPFADAVWARALYPTAAFQKHPLEDPTRRGAQKPRPWKLIHEPSLEPSEIQVPPRLLDLLTLRRLTCTEDDRLNA